MSSRTPGRSWKDMRCSRNFSHNCVNASSWAWRKQVKFLQGLQGDGLQGYVQVGYPRSIFHIEGMDNMYSKPYNLLDLSAANFFWWGSCFFVVGVGWFQIASSKNAQMDWLFDGFVGFNSWPFLTCYVFFWVGFLIWRHQALYWWCCFSSNGVILVVFSFFFKWCNPRYVIFVRVMRTCPTNACGVWVTIELKVGHFAESLHIPGLPGAENT